jgi:hypothetical protein
LKIAGLSIEQNSVKASIASWGMSGIKLLKAEEVELSGEERDKGAALSESLTSWKTLHGLKGVVVGLGPESFSHHFVELPVSSRQDIARALQYEMEKHLPLPPEEYLMDFVTVEKRASGTTRNLVLSVRRDRVKWITDSLKESGLKLLGIRCTAIEAANGLPKGEAGSDALLVYGNQERLYIMGLRDRLPMELESVSAGNGAEKVESLSRDFTGGIFVTGADRPSGIERLNPKALSGSVADLVARSALKRRAVKLDFLPEEFAGGRKDYYTYALATMCGLAVLLFFSTGLLSYHKDYSALRSVNDRIEGIRNTASELMATQRELEAIEGKRRFLLNFRSQRNRYIDALRQMSITLPKDSWLTSFSADEKKGMIEIQGFAHSTASIIGPLENSSTFKNVEFSSPVTVRNNLERFAIRMELEK